MTHRDRPCGVFSNASKWILWICFCLLSATSSLRGTPNPFTATTTDSIFYEVLPKPTFPLATATVIESSPPPWPGGSLDLVITNGFQPGEDHLAIGASGASLITTARDPATNDSLIVSFAGTPFATASGFLAAQDVTAGAQLHCVFNAQATTTAIQALLRQLVLTNDVFGFSLFETNITAHFASRACEFSLSDGTNHFATASILVDFPFVTAIRCVPQVVVVTSEVTGMVRAEAEFSNPQKNTTQRLGSQVLWSVTDPFFYTITNDAIHLETAVVGINPQQTGANYTPSADVVGVVPGTGLMATACIKAYHTYDYHICYFSFLTVPYNNCTAFSSPASVVVPHAEGSRSLQSVPTVSSDLFSLATYRALESLMNQTAEGRRLADLYWQNTSELVDIFVAHPDLIPQSLAIVKDWEPRIGVLLSSQGTNSVITAAMIRSLNLTWNRLTNYASPTLRTSLINERARFNNFQDFTGKNLADWAQMLGLPVPSQPSIHLSQPRRSSEGFSVEANYIGGLGYSLLTSLNLADWIPANGVRLLTNGLTLSLTDTNPPSPTTFYKVQAR
ncbi:MAG: hypothetical protein HY043_06940 [Verrucomicrobia bacterium]|nr:hypothetical protein [Verrucomicrobiota bacterium]